jgi:hypothetical protein
LFFSQRQSVIGEANTAKCLTFAKPSLNLALKKSKGNIMSESTNVSVNFPFLGILTLIFITLKLTGFIAWSWLWVLSPLWIPVAIVLLIAIIFGIFVAFGGTLNVRKRK